RRHLLRRMLHEDAHLACAGGEIHRAPHARRPLRILGRPVGEVAALGNLERAEEREVEMAAADHGEAVAVGEEAAARKQRDRLLRCVDEVAVLLALRRRRPDAEDAVLAVEDDLAPRRDEVGDERRQADAEIDVAAVGDVLRGAPCDLAAAERLHSGSPTSTTRSTKMPGVTIASGSRAPSSTVSFTSTTVRSAAIAITGLKFRAAFR